MEKLAKPANKFPSDAAQRTLAGVSLLGFSVWHLALYKARNKICEE